MPRNFYLLEELEKFEKGAAGNGMVSAGLVISRRNHDRDRDRDRDRDHRKRARQRHCATTTTPTRHNAAPCHRHRPYRSHRPRCVEFVTRHPLTTSFSCCPRVRANGRPRPQTDPEDIFLTRWSCSIIGPQGTAFDNRFYSLTVVCTDQYPHAPPVVTFQTRINHASVNQSTGELDVRDVLKPGAWESLTPQPTIEAVRRCCFVLQCMLVAMRWWSPPRC